MHLLIMQVYEAIQSELADGGRAYIICPLVGESSAKGFTDTKVRHHEGLDQCVHILLVVHRTFLVSLYDLHITGSLLFSGA